MPFAGGLRVKQAASAHTNGKKLCVEAESVRQRRKRWGAAVACVLVMGMLAIGAYAAVERRAAEGGKTPAPPERTAEDAALRKGQSLVFDAQGVAHILLVGVDAADENGADRSDAMMVLSINREAKRFVLASFMRDIYCAIPNHGASRLNHAYMWGGIELLCDTLEENFALAPQAYVLVDFSGFADAIDIMGGVDIELTQAEAAYLSARMGRSFSAGSVHMDGAAALEYARLREIGNADYDRTARQRGLLAAVFERAAALSLRELTALAQAVFPAVETDVTAAQLLALAAMGDWTEYDFVSFRIPVDGTVTDAVVDGMMVLDIDFTANRRAWRETVYGAAE